MKADVFQARPPLPVNRCEHCQRQVDRVWLVPGYVLDSCRACYAEATGWLPVHEQGHTRVHRAAERHSSHSRAPFYLRVDGRRP